MNGDYLIQYYNAYLGKWYNDKSYITLRKAMKRVRDLLSSDPEAKHRIVYRTGGDKGLVVADFAAYNSYVK